MVVMDERDKRPFFDVAQRRTKGLLNYVAPPSKICMRWRSWIGFLKDREIVVDIPHGDARLRDDEEASVDSDRGRYGAFLANALHPVICGGVSAQLARDVTIYWGGREEKHLYDLSQAGRHSLLTIGMVNLLSRTQPEEGWRGRTGQYCGGIAGLWYAGGARYLCAGRFEMAKSPAICSVMSVTRGKIVCLAMRSHLFNYFMGRSSARPFYDSLPKVLAKILINRQL